MVDKPEACKLCSWWQEGKGFVPDQVHPGAKITFLAQNPGQSEEERGIPLIGRSGKIVTGNLEKYGLKREDANYMNILKCRWMHENELPDDEVQNKAVLHCTSTHLLPRIPSSNVYVPVGELALNWATGHSGIEDWRGSVFVARSGPLAGRKILPTIHPSYLFKKPTLRSASKQDFARIYRESQQPTPCIVYQDNFRPCVDAGTFIETLNSLSMAHKRISLDIETTYAKPIEAHLRIVGIAWSKTDAMNWAYNPYDFDHVKVALEHYQGEIETATPFDYTVLTHYGVKFNWEKCHDLTLLHSRFDIELPHTLEFIASMWTERAYWKWMDTTDPIYNLLDCVGEWESFDRIAKFCQSRDPLVWRVYQKDRRMIRVMVALHLNGLPFSPDAYKSEKDWYEDRATKWEAELQGEFDAMHHKVETPPPCEKHKRYTGKTAVKLRKGETEPCPHCTAIFEAAENAKPLKLTSRVQMRDRLEEQDIEIPINRKTGEWTLGKGAVATIIREHVATPIAAIMARLAKFKATKTVLTRYFKEMKITKETGRVHSTYGLHAAKHRVSCKDPNAQQMKKPEEE